MWSVLIGIEATIRKAWFEGEGDKDISVRPLLCQVFSIPLFGEKITSSKCIYQLNHRQTFHFLGKNIISVHSNHRQKYINQMLPLKWAVDTDTMKSNLELHDIKCYALFQHRRSPITSQPYSLDIPIKVRQCSKW